MYKRRYSYSILYYIWSCLLNAKACCYLFPRTIFNVVEGLNWQRPMLFFLRLNWLQPLSRQLGYIVKKKFAIFPSQGCH